MINMATWIPKIVRTAKNQNVYPVSYAIQSCDYSSQPNIIKNPTTASLRRGTGGRSSFNGIVCTVFGSSGQIASGLVIRLGKIGTQLILPYRCDPYHVKELKVGGDLGQVLYHPFDLRDEESLIRCIKYSNVVVNLIGTNRETMNFSFKDVHVNGARKLAKLSKELGVERFIHLSCLNAEPDPKPVMYPLVKESKLLKTKWEGEQAVKEVFPEATIIRPSAIFGRQDKFLAHYTDEKRRFLFDKLPLWNAGTTEKQPVYFHDVISGILAIIQDPSTAGKTYQFIGPKRYLLKDIIDKIFEITLKNYPEKIKVVNMKYYPFFWLKVAFWEQFYKIHPKVDLLWEVLEAHHHSDKIDPSLPTLEDLGITPTRLEDRLEWELKTYVYDKGHMEDLEKIAFPRIQSIPK